MCDEVKLEIYMVVYYFFCIFHTPANAQIQNQQ